MSRATDNLRTSQEAADILGVTKGRVNQILSEASKSGDPIGFKHNRDWVLTVADLKKVNAKLTYKKIKI